MPHSAPQPMTLVPKPVIVTAACMRPFRTVGREHEPGAAHAESFGKGVVDLDAIDDAGRAFLGRVLDAVCNAHQVRAPVGWTTMLPRPPSTISSSDRRKFSICTV